MTYDKNGNILSLDRYGEEVAGQPIQIDELTYTYDGNRLLKVADATNNPDGFRDGSNTGNDYTYDTMGNLKTDQNKGITNVKYNHLNLPTEVVFNTGTIAYTYDAISTRVSKKVEPTGGTSIVTDYLDGFQYKDHLGNTRLSYADINNNGTIEPASEILEENNYYPFGLKHHGYNELATDAHQYKFLNREQQPELGLNTIATDYRHYDAALGRFNNMDALSELAYGQTPYRYGFNNPVYWTDPTGLFETWGAAYAWGSQYFTSFSITYSGGIYSVDTESLTFYMKNGNFHTQYWSGDNFYSIVGVFNEGHSSSGGGSGSGSSGGPGGPGPGGPSSGLGSGAGPGGPASDSGFTPIKNFWNSPIMRFVVPDKISLGFGAELAFIVGADVSTLNFTLLTRGEVGIYYTPNFSARIGAGSYVSAGVNVSTGYFTGDPSEITASMLQGSTYGVMAAGAYIGKASVGATYSPVTGSSRGFINAEIGIGIGAGPAAGAGAFGGVQYQNTPSYGTIWKWH